MLLYQVWDKATKDILKHPYPNTLKIIFSITIYIFLLNIDCSMFV